MTRTKVWAIQTKQGRFVHATLFKPVAQAYTIATFRTRAHAKSWLENDGFWRDKANVVQVVITTKELGEP